jgi:putative oxidoreductase
MNDALPGHTRDLALLVARIVLGVVLFAHGWDKLVLTGIAETRVQFEGLGIPLAIASASFVTFVEFAGGIMLVVGALTPVVALLHLVVMIGATLFVHVTNGIYVENNGWELVGVIGAAELILASWGAGRYSVDGLVLRRLRSNRDSAAPAEPEAAARAGDSATTVSHASALPEPEVEPVTAAFPVQAVAPPADTPMFGEPPATSALPVEQTGSRLRRIPRPVAPLQGRVGSRRPEPQFDDRADRLTQ